MTMVTTVSMYYCLLQLLHLCCVAIVAAVFLTLTAQTYNWWISGGFKLQTFETWGSASSVAEDSSLLGYDTVSLLMFWRHFYYTSETIRPVTHHYIKKEFKIRNTVLINMCPAFLAWHMRTDGQIWPLLHVFSLCTLCTECTVMIYDMIYLLTAIGLSPSGSTHLHTNNT
jgi:hypothetical protein